MLEALKDYVRELRIVGGNKKYSQSWIQTRDSGSTLDFGPPAVHHVENNFFSFFIQIGGFRPNFWKKSSA